MDPNESTEISIRRVMGKMLMRLPSIINYFARLGLRIADTYYDASDSQVLSQFFEGNLKHLIDEIGKLGGPEHLWRLYAYAIYSLFERCSYNAIIVTYSPNIRAIIRMSFIDSARFIYSNSSPANYQGTLIVINKFVNQLGEILKAYGFLLLDEVTLTAMFGDLNFYDEDR